MALLKKIAAAAVSAALCAALSVGAFADYTYSLDDSTLVSDVLSDAKEINGTEGTFEKFDLQSAEEDDAISMRFSVFNEYLEKTFWDAPDIVVSVDVMLETEGVDVMAFIAGFDRSWKWINPSTYYTLVPGEWVTVSETGAHFQEVWRDRGPNQFMFQVRANWDKGAQGDVKVKVKNFRITGGSAAPTPETTPEETTTTTVTTTTVVTDPPEESVPEEVTPTEETPVEENPVEENPAPATEEAPAETTAATTTTIQTTTSTTTIVTAATENAAPSMNQIVLERPDAKKSGNGIVVLVIVGVGVVVAAAAVVGYIIFKKKMF